MTELGPEERELFEKVATPLYEEATVSGGLKESDPRLAAGGELRPALDLLVSLNLLVHDRSTQQYVPVDPATVSSHVVSPMSQQGAVLLNESSEWARAFGHLSQSWRRSPSSARGPITEFHKRAIGTFIEGAVREAEMELLTAQPQAARDSAQVSRASRLSVAAEREIAALDRGVKMRTLYQHSARRHAPTRKYVARGDRARCGGAHPRRVLQPDDRHRPSPGDHPGCPGPQRRDRDPRAGSGHLPRRRVRAGLGAGDDRSPTPSAR